MQEIGDLAIRYRCELYVYRSMIKRCEDPRSPQFKDYGARGIRVCERWAVSFAAFAEDMGRRPSPKHTLERCDNSRGYEPGNCRWATRAEQMRNTRTTQVLVADGRAALAMDLYRESAALAPQRRAEALAAAPPDTLGVVQFAALAQRSEQTVKRWFRIWHAAAVQGVDCVRSRGRQGFRYVCTRSVLEQYQRGELLVPQRDLKESAAAG